MSEKCDDPGCLVCHPLVTRTGKVITQDDLDAWAAEAEAGYDLSPLTRDPDFQQRLAEANRASAAEFLAGLPDASGDFGGSPA